MPDRSGSSNASARSELAIWTYTCCSARSLRTFQRYMSPSRGIGIGVGPSMISRSLGMARVSTAPPPRRRADWPVSLPGRLDRCSVAYAASGGGYWRLVELELTVAVNDPLLAARQSRCDHTIGGRDNVGVNARVVKAEALPFLVADRRGVAIECVLIGTSHCDVGVAEATADVLVIQGLGHEAGNPREAAIGERELPHAIGPLGGDHLLENLLVALSAGLGHPAVDKLKPDTLNEIPVAIQRLVAVDPALGAAPVRTGEDLEAEDVAPASSQPPPLLADAHPQVDVLALNVQPLDLQRI